MSWNNLNCQYLENIEKYQLYAISLSKGLKQEGPGSMQEDQRDVHPWLQVRVGIGSQEVDARYGIRFIIHRSKLYKKKKKKRIDR